MRLRLAALVLFAAGFLAAALGPHCARMFAAADPAPVHHAGMDHAHHKPVPKPDSEDCAAMTAPDAVLVAASVLTQPGFNDFAPAPFATAFALPAPGIDAVVLRPPRPPPDSIGLRAVRTHRLLI